MFTKILMTSVLFMIVPLAGCSDHDDHHGDRDRDIRYSRERDRYPEHYDRDQDHHYNSEGRDRDDRSR
jgi:hypothetical protein